MSALPSPNDAPFAPVDLALYAAAVFIFGSGWLPMKMQLGTIAPEVSAVWRFLVAAPVMFAIVAATRGRLAFPLKDHALFAFLGITLFSMNFMFFYHAAYYLPSGLMSVIFSLTAVFIPLLSVVVLKLPLSPRVLLGTAAGVAGTALIFVPTVADDRGGEMGLGLALALGGTTCFALGSLVSGFAARRQVPVNSLTAWGLTYGLVVVLGISLATGARFELEWSTRYLGSLAYLIVMPTLLGFAIYLELIRRIGASRAGYGTVLFPLVALAISTAFESFHWTLAAALGIALVLAGNLLVLTPARRPA